jgi:hypothetical protein
MDFTASSKNGLTRLVVWLRYIRYNALFSKAYGSADKSVVDDIFKLMTTQAGRFFSVSHTQKDNLLAI